MHAHDYNLVVPTLHKPFSDTSTFLAARSRWMNCFIWRQSMPKAIWREWLSRRPANSALLLSPSLFADKFSSVINSWNFKATNHAIIQHQWTPLPLPGMRIEKLYWIELHTKWSKHGDKWLANHPRSPTHPPPPGISQYNQGLIDLPHAIFRGEKLCI